MLSADLTFPGETHWSAWICDRRGPDVGRPRKLFEGPYVRERIGNFDITPDGTRFVLVRRGAESTPPATLRVLVNSLAQ